MDTFTTPAASSHSMENLPGHCDNCVQVDRPGKSHREVVFSYIHVITALMNSVMFFVFAVIASHYFVQSLDLF